MYGYFWVLTGTSQWPRPGGQAPSSPSYENSLHSLVRASYRFLQALLDFIWYYGVLFSPSSPFSPSLFLVFFFFLTYPITVKKQQDSITDKFFANKWPDLVEKYKTHWVWFLPFVLWESGFWYEDSWCWSSVKRFLFFW